MVGVFEYFIVSPDIWRVIRYPYFFRWVNIPLILLRIRTRHKNLIPSTVRHFKLMPFPVQLLHMHFLLINSLLLIRPHHPRLQIFSLILLILFFPLRVQVQHPKRISQHVFLDFFINIWICVEGWRMVHFEQPRTEFVIDKHIKPQNSKTLRIFYIVRPSWPICMSQWRLDTNQSFRNNILDSLPHLIIASIFLNVIQDVLQSLLMPRVVFIPGFIVFVQFIDSVICQVNIEIFDVVARWWSISFSCETAEALFVDVRSHWIYTEY